jgi:glycosyltransferase involved in cell wall biosynthesis
MDRQMRPRVTYWTGTWDPHREAISKEVEILRRSHDRCASVVAFSPGNRSALVPTDGVWRLSARHWIAFRALAACIEPRGQVTHAFGHLDGWHLLRSLGRRPFVFTVVVPGRPLEPPLYDRVSLFAAESEPIAAALRAAGIADDRIRIVYPGVDLARFSPAPMPPKEPFRLLFASTPADPSEMEARGITLLVELARRHRDVEIVVLWRGWGDTVAAHGQLQRLNPPANFIVERRHGRHMADVYASVHATACFFRDGFGKSCPNSIIESLACGRPVLLSDTCGIAGLVSDRKAGVSAPRSVEALSAGLDSLRADFERRRAEARRLAESCFGIEGFLRSYADLYAGLVA